MEFPSLRPVRTLTWALLAVVLAASSDEGRAAQSIQIETVRPRCGQRGSMVEVVLKGLCLDEPQEIVFYRPGIRALNLSAETDEKCASTLTCRFEIAADCPLGEHPFRVRTRRELTTAQTFHVTPFKVLDEAEQTPNSNDTRDKAVAVTPNVSVRGHLVATHVRDDVDWYRVPVEKNRRLSVEVESVRIIDSPFFYPQSRIDLKLRVVDSAGRELAANDDNDLRIQDPLVSFVPAEDGEVFIEVRRSFFLANANYPYVLHVGGHRRPLAAFPPGGPAGQPLSVRFLGDPLGPYEETVSVPAEAGTFEWFGDAPTPLLLRSSRLPNVLEDAAAAATPVPALPAAVNGILETRGEVDAFRLSAKKGDRYLVRVYAATLGSPVDATIRIRPVGPVGEPGAVELEADDANIGNREIYGAGPYSGSMVPDTLDPSVVWEPKADGDYLLEVSDRFGGGATHVYRVEIEPPPPVIYIHLISQIYDWAEELRTMSLAVPSGGRRTVNLMFRRGQGNLFSGDMEVEAHGLPPGLKLVPTRIPGGQPVAHGVVTWPVTLEADDAAPGAAAAVTFSVKAVDPAVAIESRCQQLLPFANLSGGDAWRTVRLDRFVAGVVEPAPVSLAVEPPDAALLRGGELSVPVRITRQPGFDQPVDVSFGLLPPGCAGQASTEVPAGESEVMFRLTAKADAPLGSQLVYFTAQTTGGYPKDNGWTGIGRTRVASPTFSITIAEPYIELASDGPQTVRRGERKRYVWKIQHKQPLPCEAHVTLKNLPKGVRLIEPARVTKDSPEVAFDIEATDEALLGSVKGITCEVIMQLAGQEVRQQTGSGMLRVDPRL